MTPRISVVIPTHGRETRLAFALEALADGSLPHADFEVVVVRGPDASGPRATAPHGLRVVEIAAHALGPVPQRNAGWHAAGAELIAFCDDDCRPSPGWLERLLETASRNGAPDGDVVVQGRTEPDPDERHLLYGLGRSIEITGPSGLYETCNLLYPRRLLEDLGGFSDEFTLPHWGEDTDLGLRAEERGAQLVYEDSALVWHAVHTSTIGGAIREASRRRRFARLVRRHPGVRKRMLAGLFINPTHLGIACIGAALPPAVLLRRKRRPLLAIGFLPWLTYIAHRFLQQGPFSIRRAVRLALHLPLRLVLDSTETASAIRGGIEDRTPVI